MHWQQPSATPLPVPPPRTGILEGAPSASLLCAGTSGPPPLPPHRRGENIITGVVGRTVARRDARILTPKTRKHVTFYGRGDFADVIESPEMAGEPGLSG